MPFPSSDRVVFANNPLEQVITQLQFKPILSIVASQPAEFQGLIRGEYPSYTREDAGGLPTELAPFLARSGAPSLFVRDVFQSLDESRTVYLSQNFVALEDRSYKHWERFRRELRKVLTALTDVYSPVLPTRVGLRYVDVIKRSKLGIPQETPWAELINPELIGLLGQPSYRNEVTSTVAATTIRIVDVPGGEVRIHHGTRTASPSDPETLYFIDADFYTDQGRTTQDALDHLDRFNRQAGNLFRWAITGKLRDALQPTNLASELVAQSG